MMRPLFYGLMFLNLAWIPANIVMNTPQWIPLDLLAAGYCLFALRKA
jgi:hypothetical protein